METTPTCFGDVLDGKALAEVDVRQNKWDDVFMPALRRFHALYGHTDVPDDFVVPHASDGGWPALSRGLQLGQIVSRSGVAKRLYRAQVAASRSELQRLGFTWTATSAADRTWSRQVLPALETFRQQHGHCNIERAFVVPAQSPWSQAIWGLNLGAIVKRIRAQRSYTEQAARDSDRLENLAFVWDLRGVEWKDRILPALVTFADEFGDDDPMTPDFVVPAAMPWPKQTWGLSLGSFLSDPQNRERYFSQIGRDADLLDELGFEVKLSDGTWERHLIPLLTTFSTVFPREATIPEDFVVPRQTPWPPKAWGVKLGRIGVQNADRMASVKRDWQQRIVEALTTALEAPNTEQRQWKHQILPALKMFVGVFGDCRLGEHFVVPSEQPWPKQTWGSSLGRVISSVQRKGAYFQHVGRDADRLSALGFRFKFAETPWEEHVAPLLATFATLFPRQEVPEDFVVPIKAPWGEKAWGIKLGALVCWNAPRIAIVERAWKIQVLTAVEVFRHEFGDLGDLETFLIPSQHPWPEKTWGMDLIRIQRRLQSGEFYDGHAAQVKSALLGLSTNEEEEWEKVLAALRSFSTQHGHCVIEERFVVPAKDPWPQETWNLALGQIVSGMQSRGAFFTQIGQSASVLSALGFALKLSPTAWKELVGPLIATFSTLFPREVIAVNFAIPSTKPWPEKMWGLQLGKIVCWNFHLLDAIERDWRKQFLAAVEVFRKEQGNAAMEDTFVIPSRAPWPSKTWGLNLGRWLSRLRDKQRYNGHVAQAQSHLIEVGLRAPEHSHGKWETVILPALHTFAKTFGHCAVEPRFVVPSEAPWPKQTWGLRLGDLVASMERSGDYFREIGQNADRLAAFGFRYRLADEPWREHVAPLLTILSTKFPHEIIPEDFVVPATTLWPEQVWGLKLGKILAWSSRFVWKSEQNQWQERVMPADTALAGAFGHCRVSAKFVVPSEMPWPKQMWGLKFAVILRQMQQSGDLPVVAPVEGHAASNDLGFIFQLSGPTIGALWEPSSSLGKRQVPMLLPHSMRPYSPKSRQKRVEKYREKRAKRVWQKEIRYDVRKSSADTRLRVKGRFVTNEDATLVKELLSFT
ncbi:hypothetical protein BBJ28_00010196 [Nothophytophthora sp. Chile5]|nr:hypothetical protein BBJ28_00010196 [Nothophytophthora sp. Chile5]